MKRIFLLLIMIGYALTGFSQTDYYYAFRTEVYEQKSYSKNWNKVDENTDLNIQVALTRSVISINARQATSFKLSRTYKESVLEYNTLVTRWDAMEITDGRECTVDLVKYENTNYLVLSIIYWQTFPVTNLRYYLRLD